MNNELGRISALLTSDRPTISFEFFPPKDDQGFDSLRRSFELLQGCSPDFISVTYGAMGSNQDRSLAVVQEFASQIPTISHLTCIGTTKKSIVALLAKYGAAQVAGILALRGDIPPNFEGTAFGEFRNANELVQLISESGFDIGVAAFPEKHPESPTLEHDLRVLKLKQESGAAFAMTQLFFDIDAYFSLVKNARDNGISIPIVPGLMPIANTKQVLRMAEMSGARIPEELVSELDSARDDEHARVVGMQFSVNLAKELLSRGAPGLHIFTLNHHRASLELLQGAGLT